LAQSFSRDVDVQSFDPARQIAALQRAQAIDPAASLISIANSDGITVARSTGEQPGIDRRQEIAGMAQLFQTHQSSWDLIQSPSLGVPVIAIRVPIIGPEGEFEGGVAIQVRLSTFNGQLQSLLTSLGGRIIIVDDQGRVIAHPDPAYVRDRADLSASPPIAAARAGHMESLVYREGGRRWLAAPVYVKELGWTIDAERPQLLVLAPAIQAREQATIFLLIVVAIAGGVAFAFAQDLIQPIATLVHAARSLGEGVVETDLPAAGEDEVGQLVHAFGEMRDRLVARTAERERAVKAAADLVQELRQSEERFRHQALSDALTGLPNRTDFMDELTREVEAAKQDGRTLAVLFMDLDGFKTINDSLGHALGDEILIAVGQRLQDACADGESLARFGGTSSRFCSEM
jgi:HAMP domain-containing protein